MKICLVTAFPPSKRGLSEYGFHIARELQRDPLISVTILADVLSADDAEEAELADYDVVRCWNFNAVANPHRLLRAIRQQRPDVVWFNLLFSTFGEEPLPAFCGLITPLLSRLRGEYTHVTLHHLMDNIDLGHAQVRLQKLYRLAGNIATRALLMSNSISVLLPAYRRTLIEKYGGENVHFRAHGILSTRPEYPNFDKRGNPEHRIIAFGKWGTYKRLELLIEAFAVVAEKMPAARLIIGGGDHPLTPGYVRSVAERFRASRKIEFTGYVREEAIPELFSSSSVMVMPYSSAAGSSGVAHLACAYGVPIVCADINDFHQMAEDEGLAVLFYETGNVESLSTHLIELLNSPQRMRDMAEHNFSAALRMTMPLIIRQYLRSFSLHQKRKSLEPLARFRRLPAWIPSRSKIFRAAAPRWEPWM
jgi:glycosyltransferase involved in cell wall biosynthesis